METNECYLKIMFCSYVCLMTTGLKKFYKARLYRTSNIVVDVVKLQEEK